MGSSKSKPRKKRKPQKHLPKVGTPQNLAWRNQGARDDAFKVFGSRWVAIVLAAFVVMALVGLLFITA